MKSHSDTLGTEIKEVSNKTDYTDKSTGKLSLHQAIAANQLSVVQAILEAKGDPNIIEDQWPALSAAAYEKNVEIVKELLGKNANPNIGLDKDQLPLSIAANTNAYDIAKILLEFKADPKIGNPLIEASRNKEGEPLVRMLLKTKADVNATNSEDSALSIAVQAGNSSVFTALLEAKADPMQAGLENKTAVYHAVNTNNLTMLSQMVPLQEHFKQRVHGDTLLHTAVKKASTEVINFLLDQKIDPNIRDAYGNTPLGIAANTRQLEQLMLLQSKGATTGYAKLEYDRVLEYAAHNGLTDVVKILLNNDEEKVKTYLSKKRHSQKRALSLSEIKHGTSDYIQIMQNLIQEQTAQAARIIQRNWREKSASSSRETKTKGTETKEYLTLKLLQEPWGAKYKEHAEKIKAGEWLSLEFEHAEFERDLFKAVRLGAITKEEMVTANLLYHAKKEFKQTEHKDPLLRQFSYEEKGPYDISQLSYVSNNPIVFINRLKSKVPKNQQCYFTANCNRVYEYYFLQTELSFGESFTNPKFIQILKKLVAKMSLSDLQRPVTNNYGKEIKKDEVYQAINGLTGIKFNEKTATPEILAMFSCLAGAFYAHYTDIVRIGQENIEMIVRESARFAAALFRTNSEAPLLEISPDYDENNASSPLLCRLITSVASFEILQEWAHHSLHVSEPYFTVGKFSTTFMRKLDENPWEFKMTKQRRPVELVHPDVIYNNKPHGYLSFEFELTEHDRSFHCWRTSTLPIKPFIRYLRELHDIKGYIMSKTIWKLTDMDNGIGKAMRQVYLNTKSHAIMTRYGCSNALRLFHRDDFFIDTDKYDDNLIIILSMLMQTSMWHSYIDQDPFDFMTAPPYQYMSEKDTADPATFNLLWNKLENIIARYPNYKLKNGCMLFIIAYRLNGNIEGLAALDKLAKETNSLTRFFYWKHNGGICFKGESMKENSLEKLSPEAIAALCIEINKIIETEKITQAASVEKTSKEVTMPTLRLR